MRYQKENISDYTLIEIINLRYQRNIWTIMFSHPISHYAHIRNQFCFYISTILFCYHMSVRAVNSVYISRFIK